MAEMQGLKEALAAAKQALEERDAAIAESSTVKSAMKSLEEKVAATPSFGGLHHGNGVSSYYEEDEGPAFNVVPNHDPNRYRRDASLSSTIINRQSALKSLKSQGYVRACRNATTFKSMGDFFRQGMASGSPEGNSKFRDTYRSHMKAIQGMSEAVGSEGGFGVLPEWNLKIHEHIYSNDLISRCDSYTVSGNSMSFLANAETSRKTGFRAGGLTGYWTGEGAAGVPSKPTIREFQMKLYKLMVVVYLTDELLKDNGIALEQYVTRKAAEEFQWLIGDALFNGSGAGKPLGIQNAPSLIAIAEEAGPQATTTIVSQNIIKMQNRLFAPYMANASWFVNQDTIQQLMQLTLATGTYSGQLVYQPPTGLSGAPYGTLGGRPVEPIEFAQTLGTQGDITLADLSQMICITKGGVEQATSMHVEFLTDQIALRFTMRINAQPWENSPITPANGTNTQSSFVTLAVRNGS